MFARSAGGLLFLTRALLSGLFSEKPAGVLVGTSPPMAPIFGRIIAAVRRSPLLVWLMDLNPDQAVITGAISRHALRSRLLELSNAVACRSSQRVIVLDRFMADRVSGRWVDDNTLAIVPPWPHEDHISPVAHEDNSFRVLHGLAGKRVVMYSGNLSPVHPLGTILDAARELRDEKQLLFLFVGEGGQKADIEARAKRDRLDNVRLLPYQPQELLRYSLSAADVHLVSMGDDMVGIVHPCKIYGAMASGRPILYLGSRRSHIGELMNRFDLGWQVDHGDIAGAVTALREIVNAPASDLEARGNRARRGLSAELSQPELVDRFCDLVGDSFAMR